MTPVLRYCTSVRARDDDTSPEKAAWTRTSVHRWCSKCLDKNSSEIDMPLPSYEPKHIQDDG
jgi:hypothetical protein